VRRSRIYARRAIILSLYATFWLGVTAWRCSPRSHVVCTWVANRTYAGGSMDNAILVVVAMAFFMATILFLAAIRPRDRISAVIRASFLLISIEIGTHRSKKAPKSPRRGGN
jgi:hypothetical protein